MKRSTPQWTDAFQTFDNDSRRSLGWFASSVARIVEPIACFRRAYTAEDLQGVRDMIAEIERGEAVSVSTHRDLDAEC